MAFVQRVELVKPVARNEGGVTGISYFLLGSDAGSRWPMIIIVGASLEGDGLYWIRFECSCKAAITTSDDKPFKYCAAHDPKTIHKDEIDKALEWRNLLTGHAEIYYRNLSNSVCRALQESRKQEHED
jgi:hypothetical protein